MCLEQTIRQHPGTHEPFASKKPRMDVALHVSFGYVTAGVGAVLPGSPSGFCTHSIVPVNRVLLWGFISVYAVLSVHLSWCCEALQRIKAGIKDSVRGVGGSGKNSAAVVELKINQADELSVPQLETPQKPLIGWLMFGMGNVCWNGGEAFRKALLTLQ